MNLRHIDPRSMDWMDAMLEGEQSGRQRHVKRDGDHHVAAGPGGAEMLSAGAAESQMDAGARVPQANRHHLESRPPPAR